MSRKHTENGTLALDFVNRSAYVYMHMSTQKQAGIPYNFVFVMFVT